MKTILPGITNIYSIPCDQLPTNLAERHMVGLPISLFGDIQEIPFAGEPTCSSTREYKNNGSLYKTELKFITSDRLAHNGNIAFIVAAPSKQHYLIGTLEKPYPIVKETRIFGQTKDYSGYSYEISFTSVVGVINCII